MTAPTPRAFDRSAKAAIARVRRELADLDDLYATAYDAGHTTAVRGSAGKIAVGGVNDPTGVIVGDPLDPRRPGAQAGLRRSCERASRKLAEIENMAASIRPELQRSLDRLDPRETFEPTRYPVSVTNAELEESRSAQRRRDADAR